MKIIPRADIDIDKWDQLVAKKANGLHSFSWWLDAIAENWSIYTDESYSCGIALPYTRRAGMKVLYTPIFSECLEVISEFPKDDFNEAILEEFEVIETGFNVPILKLDFEEHVSQILTTKEPYKKLANRMLKKALSYEFIVKEVDDFLPVFRIIESELIGKVNSINEVSLAKLKNAITIAEQQGFIKVISVFKSNEIVGGLILLENDSVTYYLKGACTKDAREAGGMYAAMDYSIHRTLEKGKLFDFGGSRVEGVRKFNKQFGAEDIFRPYYSYSNAPFWYKASKRLKKFFTAS